MKKLYSLLVALFVMAAPLTTVTKVQAGDAAFSSYSNFHISPSKSTATANKSDSITFTISFFVYKCASGVNRILASNCASEGGVASEKAITCDQAACQSTNYAHAKITASGSGNTLSKSILYPSSSGKATFTLKSSAAGSKTIKVSNEAPASSGSYAETSKTVSFTAAPAAKPKTTITPTTTEKKTVAAPSTPKLATVTIGNQVVDATKKVEVEEDKPLVLGGKTVANGKITLYIFSDPKTATVTADKNGNWAYSVTDLPAGDHHIESEVTDPATNKTSKRESVLAFSVTAAEASPTVQSQAMQTAAPKSKTTLVVAIASAVAVAVLAASGFWWWKKHTKTPAQNMAEAVNAFKEKEDEKPDAPEKEASEDDTTKEKTDESKDDAAKGDSEDKESKA